MLWMKKRILVIDDEKDLTFFLKQNLESMGKYEVIVASSGEEGIAAALKQRPDLILLDIMMPSMDGFAVLDVLRHKHRETSGIPVAMLTAKRESSSIMRAELFGIVDYIMKPFTVSELLEVVSKYA